MVIAKMSFFWPKKGLVGPNLQKKQIILIYIVLLMSLKIYSFFKRSRHFYTNVWTWHACSYFSVSCQVSLSRYFLLFYSSSSIFSLALSSSLSLSLSVIKISYIYMYKYLYNIYKYIQIYIQYIQIYTKVILYF